MLAIMEAKGLKGKGKGSSAAPLDTSLAFASEGGPSVAMVCQEVEEVVSFASQGEEGVEDCKREARHVSKGATVADHQRRPEGQDSSMVVPRRTPSEQALALMDESPPLSRSSSITAIALEEATSEEDGGEAEGPSPPHPSASSSVQLLQPSSSGKSLRSVSESLAADSSSMAGAASEGPVSEEPHKVITVGREGKPRYIKVAVHRGTGLLPRDRNSFTDALVSIRLAGRRVCTGVAYATSNPTWEQELYMELPEVLTRQNGELRMTVRDYDGVVVQPRLVGLATFSVLDVWGELSSADGVRRKWYNLTRSINGRLVDRGRLSVSLSVVGVDQLPNSDAVSRSAGSATNFAAYTGTDRLESDLEDKSLRVTIHEARGLTTTDAQKMGMEAVTPTISDPTQYKYAMTMRFGGSAYNTSYQVPREVKSRQPSECPQQDVRLPSDDPGSGIAACEPGLYHLVWNESFDIPLKEVMSKQSWRLTNRLIQFGNKMGFDGVFYDSREDVTTKEELRFIAGRVPESQAETGGPSKAPTNATKVREKAVITGTGQYPITGIQALRPSPPASQSGLPNTPSPKAERPAASEKGTSSSPVRLRPNAEAQHFARDFIRGFKSMFGGPEKKADLEEVKEEPQDDRQRIWVTLDHRGGLVSGEVLISFSIVDGSGEGGQDGVATGLPEDSVDFDSWHDDCLDPSDDDYGDGAPMDLLPPLKDGTFVDEELDIPLHKLFYQLVNQDSAFNMARQREQGIRDLVYTPWDTPPEGGSVRKRRMTFIIKLPKTMLGPSEAYSEVDTKIPTLSLRGFVISSTISTPKILFGDVFYTVMQEAAVPCGPSRCRMQTSFAVEFRKSSMFQGAITSGAIDGARVSCKKELGIIQNIIANRGEDLGPGPTGEQKPIRTMTIGRVIEDIQIVQMQVNDRRFVAGAVLVALLAMGVAAANRSKLAEALAAFLLRWALSLDPKLLSSCCPGPEAVGEAAQPL